MFRSSFHPLAMRTLSSTQQMRVYILSPVASPQRLAFTISSPSFQIRQETQKDLASCLVPRVSDEGFSALSIQVDCEGAFRWPHMRGLN